MELNENLNNTTDNIFKINTDIISNLINLIISNNLFFDNDFPFIFEKKYKELSFLNHKRIISDNTKNNIQYKQEFNTNSPYFYISDKLKNEINILKDLKLKEQQKIFKICKDFRKIKSNNYSYFYKNNKYYNNSYKIENSNYIFINKSNIKGNRLNDSIMNEDDKINKNNILLSKIILINIYIYFN